MDFLVKRVMINSKKYGKVKSYIARISKYGNGYLVFTKKFGKKLTGYVDKNGKEIIPLQEMELTGVMTNGNYRDVCFEFTYPDSVIPEYYHVKNYKSGKAKVVLKTGRLDDVPLVITPMEDTTDYWLLEAQAESPQYAIYDFKKSRIITTFVDEIHYQDDGDPSHIFYFGLAITSNIPQPNGTKLPYTHSSLFGFLDENGQISSELYDSESDAYYSSYMYGPDTLSPKFNELVNHLTDGYERLYYEKAEKVDLALEHLYISPNLSEKPKNFKEGQKVLEFRKKG